MVEKNIIAVIPARGGSTRIPHKNIIDFLGKPLLAWTIEAVKNSGCFDRIIVSTDDEEIANVAIDCGIEVPFLRNKYADNASSVIAAALYSAEQAEVYFKQKYTDIAVFQATTPLRDSIDVKNVYDFYIKNDELCVTTANKYNMNPWWCAILDDKNKPTFLLSSPDKCNSQSSPHIICPNGAITMFNKEWFKKTQNIYCDELKMYELSWKHSVDIDDYDDIEMAKLLYKLNGGK